jgi:hypothetical protein
MFYRSIKVQHKTNKRLKIGFKYKGAREQETECALVWRTGLSGAPGPYNLKLATLGFLRARSAIIHRTVRCTSGATATCATVDCKSRADR